ncbi:hypothetical protein LA080_010511 [Diaporthe eres]|nr:hypothetical protein LA080_010511 [Diaporthe eres]
MGSTGVVDDHILIIHHQSVPNTTSSFKPGSQMSYIVGRRRTIFKRLLNTLPILNIVAALTAGSSVGALSFDDFHPSSTSLCHASEALLTSCAIAAVISIMLSTMLIFWFETVDSRLMGDYCLLWTPVILLNWAILIGLQTGILLLFSTFVAVRMTIALRRAGNFGTAGEAVGSTLSDLESQGRTRDTDGGATGHYEHL